MTILIPTASNAGLNDGLVGCWQFDEGTGTDAFDCSGNGNDGTLSNGPSWVGGQRGPYALSFDATDDLVTIPDDDSLEGMPQLTITAWYYATGGGENGSGRIIDKNDGGSYSLKFSGGATSAIVGTVNGSTLTISAIPNSSSVWHHIAMIYDGQEIKIFIDGKRFGGSTALTGSVATNASTVTIGNLPAASRTMSGNIDDVRIYNRALTPSEVYALYIGYTAKIGNATIGNLQVR